MKNFLLALLLCVMVAIESTTIKYVKKIQLYDIPSEQLVLLVEICKFLLSLLIYVFEKASAMNMSNTRHYTHHTRYNSIEESEINVENERNINSSLVWYMLPAVLYAVSNNVTFAALALMPPAMFNLLMNLKIPMTAFMAWMFIRYEINKNLLISFAALFLGSIIASVKFSSTNGPSIEGSLLGLILMLVYSACSAGGAVYTEYVTKMRFQNENMFLQNMKFCICSALSNIIIIMIRGVVPYTQVEWIHLASVLVLVLNGLMTAAVLKFGGSILKTYSVSVAMFFSALLTWLIFGYKLSWNFYVGALICACAVQLYAHEKK